MAEAPECQIQAAAASLSLDPSPSAPATAPAEMTPEEKYDLVRSIGEECIQEEELRNLLAKKSNPVCYDGFEPSGRMHIAQGVMKAINVNKLTSAGCTMKFWVADWFAQLNNKMGGDLKKIRTVGHYFIEIWKAVGMNLDKVEFLWSSEEIERRHTEYWPLVMDIARRNKLPRIIRCSQIMGRNEQEELSAAQILYPCMQCADIFFLKADICQLGMDQRKVNVLAREYCDDIKRKNKPIILSHHMLPGLQQGQEKMSKSDPTSSIFMEDEEAEVNVKIKKAYCPPKLVEGNPCLEYIKHIIFPWFGHFEIERQAENGGNKTFISMEELIVDYESGALHPADVKPAIAKSLNKILQPVRDHFKNNSKAKELLKTVKEMEGSFISLLNEGSFSQFEGMLFSQQTPQSQPLQEAVHNPTQEPPKKKGKRSKNFLIEEDMLLISAWLNVSIDQVQGSNQTHTYYWNRIWNYYEENKEGLASERTAISLCNRWCTINEKVTKFIGFYNQICRRNQNGLSEQDKVDQAIEMYGRLMPERFTFIRHWNALRFSSKYQASLAKKNKPVKDKETSSQSVDSQISVSLESDEMMEHPIGRKAVKKLKSVANEANDEKGLKLFKTMQKDAWTIASSRRESLQMSLQLQKEMMQLQKEELQLRLVKEERERQKEERERQIYEASIMAMDTSKMLPDQAKYYDALKARIMRNI